MLYSPGEESEGVLGKRPVIRIERNDSDERFRAKVNRNFDILSQGTEPGADTAIITMVSPMIADAISVAVDNQIRELIGAEIDAKVPDIAEDTASAVFASLIGTAFAERMQAGALLIPSVIPSGGSVDGSIDFDPGFPATGMPPIVIVTSRVVDLIVTVTGITVERFYWTAKNTGGSDTSMLGFSWIAMVP